MKQPAGPKQEQVVCGGSGDGHETQGAVAGHIMLAGLALQGETFAQ